MSVSRIHRFAAVLILAGVLGAPVEASDGESVRKIDLNAIVENGELDADVDVATSGVPTEAALAALHESGFTTVVDLRGEHEKDGADSKSAVESQGMSYVALPVTSRDDLSIENAKTLDAIIAEAKGPVLVHCGSGNRAGALLALRASANGATDEVALEVGRKAGMTRSEGVVSEKLTADKGAGKPD